MTRYEYLIKLSKSGLADWLCFIASRENNRGCEECMVHHLCTDNRSGFDVWLGLEIEDE